MTGGRYESRDPQRLGYVVSRFPKLSETFIVREMEALERLGWRITVFPFIRLREPVRQPGVDRWQAHVIAPDSMLGLLAANLHWLRRAPGRLLSLYALTIRGLWRYPGVLARGVLAVARGAQWAERARAAGIAHMHAHFAQHPAIAALTVARLAGISFSFTCHAQDVYVQPAMLGEKAREASFVIAISRLMRDRYLAPLVAPADRARIHVVRCGVEATRYEVAPSWPPDGALEILAVARLADKKGLRYLIDACEVLRARGHDIRCRIIGDGPLRARLQEQIVAARLGDVVTLRGACPQDAVRRALGSAAIFVQPSVVTAAGDMEGVPVSMMEAMAAGVPVVATDTGAIAELVQDEQTGLLVEPGSTRALADAIERIARDPALARRLRVAARRQVEGEFDLARNAALLDRYLRRAVSEWATAR